MGARMSNSGNGLPAETRDGLERIVIELVGIAARPEIDPALREGLMRLAAHTSSTLENDGGSPTKSDISLNIS